jgi:hypothetical protein
MAFDGVRRPEMVSAAVGWSAVATYQTRSGHAMPSIIHDARERLSQLTTRLVNAFATHRHPSLFHVVSGSRTQIGPIVFPTRQSKNATAFAIEPSADTSMPFAHAALKDAPRRFAVPPLGRHP